MTSLPEPKASAVTLNSSCWPDTITHSDTVKMERTDGLLLDVLRAHLDVLRAHLRRVAAITVTVYIAAGAATDINLPSGAEAGAPSGGNYKV